MRPEVASSESLGLGVTEGPGIKQIGGADETRPRGRVGGGRDAADVAEDNACGRVGGGFERAPESGLIRGNDEWRGGRDSNSRPPA